MTLTTTADVLLDDARCPVRFHGKYLSVTTFRRSGDPVATPVWFVEDSGLLYVDTDGTSGKAKRIRANPHVLVAPCTAAGRLRASPVPATAQIIESGEMPASARTLYARKYRADRVLVLPVYRLLKAFKGGAARSSRPVVLVIDPSGR